MHVLCTGYAIGADFEGLQLSAFKQEVVISGDYDREQAMALIDYSKQQLLEHPIFGQNPSWTVVQIIRKTETVFIRLTDGGEKDVAFTIRELPGGRFELIRDWCTGDPYCAERGV